jgi:hypothetical protein
MSFATLGSDGSPEVYAQNAPSPPAAKEIDGSAVKELLAFCQNHRTGFAIKTGGAWGYPFWGLVFRVTYRSDGTSPKTETWLGSPTVDEVMYPLDALAFMRSLPDEGSIFFRVTDAQGRDHDATFQLHGVARARDLIASACERP